MASPAPKRSPCGREVEAPTGGVSVAKVATPKDDIAFERSRASFSSRAMAAELYGGIEVVEKREMLVKMLEDDPIFDKTMLPFMSRTDKHTRGLKMAYRMVEMVLGEGLDREDGNTLRKFIDDPGPLDLHWGMFVPTLIGQGSEEQREEWLPRALQLEVVGTYAQTEMGHGTFLRGLETTATYIPETEEFDLHSPTLTSMKWWPGGLGKTANHAVVMARLMVGGEDRGPHPFIVQLRSTKDHMPMPGIMLMDIGPKLGFHAVDNGCMRFDHVRVPRSSLLAKNSRVEADGTYVKPPVAKASYGTMVFVRATIVADAGMALAKGVTIAVRYNAVRRQSRMAGAVLETQVLDYQSNQHKLLPRVAAAYALFYTGDLTMRNYRQFEDDRDANNFGALPELHATSAGLKALSTWMTAEGIEEARICCGGHGYSMFSGLPQFYASAVAAVTYEGENNVMYLQTARYLIKKYRENPTGVPKDTCSASTAGEMARHATLLAAYRHRTARTIAGTFKRLRELEESGKSSQDAWGECLVDLMEAAKAHCMEYLLRTFAEGIKSCKNESMLPILSKLLSLFGLWYMERELGSFMEDGYMSPAGARLVHEAVRDLLAALRPEAVALVDSFALPDYYLNSALGAYDGDVYNRMVEWAKYEPLNKSEVPPAFEAVMKPVIMRASL